MDKRGSGEPKKPAFELSAVQYKLVEAIKDGQINPDGVFNETSDDEGTLVSTSNLEAILNAAGLSDFVGELKAERSPTHKDESLHRMVLVAKIKKSPLFDIKNISIKQAEPTGFEDPKSHNVYIDETKKAAAQVLEELSGEEGKKKLRDWIKRQGGRNQENR